MEALEQGTPGIGLSTPGDPGRAAPLGPSAAPLGANGLVGDPTSISELYDPTRVLRVKVSLQSVRLLSIGKVSQAPAPKGVQPQRPLTPKSMPVAGTQPVTPVYLGQDGHTICTLAYGDEVMRCTSVKMGTRYWLVFCPGQLGVLYWSDGWEGGG